MSKFCLALLFLGACAIPLEHLGSHSVGAECRTRSHDCEKCLGSRRSVLFKSAKDCVWCIELQGGDSHRCTSDPNKHCRNGAHVEAKDSADCPVYSGPAEKPDVHTKKVSKYGIETICTQEGWSLYLENSGDSAFGGCPRTVTFNREVDSGLGNMGMSKSNVNEKHRFTLEEGLEQVSSNIWTQGKYRVWHGTPATEFWDGVASGTNQIECGGEWVERAAYGEALYTAAGPGAAPLFYAKKRGYVVLLEISNCPKEGWDADSTADYIFLRPVSKEDHTCQCQVDLVAIFDLKKLNEVD